ncbi:hypothetical protein SAMN05421504_109322 [Amycolatopsis xylanica]|uniref:Peptidase inhibitor family I36 n=1 Tax=Amycolatopsis xylanica TaxID=589385 RepID=A0A1H3QH82_9PSEU|nr:hypothetical protein [Amycolatopsis xylanica]SDZ12653.1 hypothetical protein SAMN05421504_109322 [Amycolatopsis xylanica]
MGKARWTGLTAAVGIALAILTPDATAAPGDHCVADVGTGAVACFATEAAADAYHPAAKPRVELARLYDLPGYRGPSLRLDGDAAQCTPSTADPEVAVPNLALSHWDNRASSFKVAAQCRVKLWDGDRYAGQSTEGGRDGYLDHSENLAIIGFDNRATSLKIS